MIRYPNLSIPTFIWTASVSGYENAYAGHRELKLGEEVLGNFGLGNGAIISY